MINIIKWNVIKKFVLIKIIVRIYLRLKFKMYIYINIYVGIRFVFSIRKFCVYISLIMR